MTGRFFYAYFYKKYSHYLIYTCLQLSFAKTKPISEAVLIEKAIKAIKDDDPETIKGLRDKVKPEFLSALMKQWNANLPWTQKTVLLLC